MRRLCAGIVLILIQPQFGAANLAAQSQSVLRLPPNAMGIPKTSNGKIVELINSAPILMLPVKPPAESPTTGPWFVDIRNLGPKDVTVQGANSFSVLIHPNDFVRIRAVGNVYVFAGRPKN
jgi:hypothetical protein